MLDEYTVGDKSDKFLCNLEFYEMVAPLLRLIHQELDKKYRDDLLLRKKLRLVVFESTALNNHFL